MEFFQLMEYIDVSTPLGVVKSTGAIGMELSDNEHYEVNVCGLEEKKIFFVSSQLDLAFFLDNLETAKWKKINENLYSIESEVTSVSEDSMEMVEAIGYKKTLKLEDIIGKKEEPEKPKNVEFNSDKIVIKKEGILNKELSFNPSTNQMELNSVTIDIKTAQEIKELLGE